MPQRIKMQIIDQLKRKFDRMPSSKRRMITFAGAMVLLSIFMYVLYGVKGGDSQRLAREAAEEKKNFELPHTNVSANSWVETGQIKLEKQEKEIANMSKQIEDLKKMLESGKIGTGAPGQPGPQDSSVAAQREQNLLDDLKKQGVDVKAPNDNMYPLTPVKPNIPGKVEAAAPPATGQKTEPAVQSPPQPTARAARPTVKSANQSPDSIMGVYLDISSGDTSATADQSATDKQSEKKWEKNFYMPRGTFFEVKLLSGMDASTAPTTKREGGKDDGGQLSLMRVQDLSFLPNGIRQNVAGCFLMVQGFGDLASERAKMRGVGLSCVNRDDEKILDDDISGFVMDTDGKDGLRGNVVSKRGRFLQMAMVSTIIRATGQAFASLGTSSQQYSVVPNGQGFFSTQDTMSMGEGFKRGLGQGVSDTANKMTDWFMQQVDKMHPVIEIGATRSATFVVSQGRNYKFSKKLTEGADPSQTVMNGVL